jgi:hypothetical protein
MRYHFPHPLLSTDPEPFSPNQLAEAPKNLKLDKDFLIL